jgi:GAF domain-containing protein
MNKDLKYDRIKKQIEELCAPIQNPMSRMATINAVLHNKMKTFFWTGFYLLTEDGELEVGPYQGELACLRLKKHTGVCWAGIDRKETIIVADVHQFDGHIACNSLSKSEIVIPLEKDGEIIGVFDVDSDKANSFDKIDAKHLESIMKLIY